MTKGMNYGINEEDIAGIELLCCEADNKELLAKVGANCKDNNERNKEFSIIYLFLMSVLGNYDDNLYLEGIRIAMKDGSMHYILSSQIKEKNYVINDNLIRFIKNVANYVIAGNEIGVNRLNLSTLDYVKIDNLSLVNNKIEKRK